MIRGFSGACGCGKTFTMQARIGHELARRMGWRFLFLDPNEECPGPALAGWSRHAREVDSARDAARALRVHPLVVVRPPVGTELGPRRRGGERFAGFGDELARVCIEGPPTVLVCPEAHRVMPASFRELDPHLSLIVHQWRHRRLGGVGLWWDTQYLADVAAEVRKGSSWLYLFGTGSGPDLATIRDYGGPELVAAVQECGSRALRGEKGHHVLVSPLSARPPYTIRRIRPPGGSLRSAPEKSSGASPELRTKVLTGSEAPAYAKGDNAGGPGRENP